MKRESKRFHSIWVDQRMPAMEDTLEMAGGVAMAMEGCGRSTLSTVPCNALEQGACKDLKDQSSPSALETRARTKTCSGNLKRRWPPRLEPSLVTMGLRGN
jgi:hypothetical protein